MDDNKRPESTTNDNGAADNQSSKRLNILFWIIAAVVLLVCIIYGCVILRYGDNERGTFGDAFGALGALFSGFAFAGVIVAMRQQNEDLLLQRKDLELQRQEIAQTNQELALQRKEMEEQNKTIMLQRFENTFFSMLEVQQSILMELEIVNEVYDVSKKTMGSEEGKSSNNDINDGIIDHPNLPDSIRTATAAIMGRNMSHNLGSHVHVKKALFDELEKCINSGLSNPNIVIKRNQKGEYRGRDAMFRIRYVIENEIIVNNTIEDFSIDNVLKVYEDYIFTGGRISPYFQQVYLILKLIDGTYYLTQEEKYNYASILRATFTRDELVLIFYYCLYDKYKRKNTVFKEMVEKYALFINLEPNLLISRTHYDEYESGAYESEGHESESEGQEL